METGKAKRITDLRIIKHFKGSVGNEIHGIYECMFNGQKKLLIRHGAEVVVVEFLVGRPVKECLFPVRDDVANELFEDVEEVLNCE